MACGYCQFVRAWLPGGPRSRVWCGEDGELPGQAAKHWGEGGASSEALASIALKHNVSVYAAVSMWRARAEGARVCRCGVCVCMHAHKQRKGEDR